MQVNSHATAKYGTGRRLTNVAEWNAMRVECWGHEAGTLNNVQLDCTEIGVLLAGQVNVRRTGDGQTQTAFGRPGTSWICPAGVFESDIELSAPMVECLHIFLPPTLLEKSALQDYGIDPARTKLGYAGGLADPLLLQIATTLRLMLDRDMAGSERLMIDGLRTTLAAHLVGQYSADQWRPAEFRVPTSLDGPRLQRVLDFIETNLANELTLDDLAAEACLSAFHFARLFRQAAGLTPHRYVTERRIAVAKEKLGLGRMSLTEIALETGFGSPANFSRAFRRATGCSPGQYKRAIY